MAKSKSFQLRIELDQGRKLFTEELAPVIVAYYLDKHCVSKDIRLSEEDLSIFDFASSALSSAFEAAERAIEDQVVFIVESKVE